jgi:hypothetical protein
MTGVLTVGQYEMLKFYSRPISKAQVESRLLTNWLSVLFLGTLNLFLQALGPPKGERERRQPR